MSKKTTVSGILLVLLVLATTPLLGTDNVSFLKWWLMTLVFGIGFYPAAAALFPRFHDRGWMFSKVLGIVVSGFAVFALGSFGLVPFTAPVCLITVGVLILASWIFGCFKVRVHAPEIDFLMMEEVLFFAFFLLWTYLAGFHPEAHGTEKFMDYGFMKAMMRSTAVPAEDLWYSGSGINYYYGGQFYAVFLTKITFTDVKQTYHLMRTMVASFAFVLPFSITYHLAESRACHRIRKEGGNKSQIAPVLGGLLSGGAVSLAGNMHYVIYGCIRQWLGLNESAYWFPSSTRYIGYDPLVENDRTIHEFPSYSFVLGDLHAHVVNVMFVLLVLCLLYSYVKNTCRDPEKEWKWSLKDVLLQPQIIAAGFLTGVFHWSNYWDFVIYFVVITGFALYGALYRYHARAKETIGTVLLQAAEVFAIGTIVALPFTMKFETMVSGVGIAGHHSMLYQLAILWGLPTLLVVLFIAAVLLAWRKNRHLPGMERQGQIVLADGKTQEEVEEQAVALILGEKKPEPGEKETTEKPKKVSAFCDFWREIAVSDMVIGILGLCAIGLIIIPELVYVRDIYEESYARSNTMFKLTYQAFILFGICMSYIITRFLLWKKERILQVFGGIGLVLLLWTFGYFGTSVYSWFGNVFDLSEYRGLDATAYLENVFSEDAGAIRWLDETIEGQPVVLEANGDSYSDYERVSAMTGLPTVLGWYVHEWLWRGNPADLNVRAGDVKQMYTSTDTNEVLRLLEQYHVTYIFVGSKEKEKYGDALNESLLQSIGDIVYQDTASGTYILQVQDT